MNATYFINKFKNIPDDQWTEGSYGELSPQDGATVRHCAVGHCGVFSDKSQGPTETQESVALEKIINDWARKRGHVAGDPGLTVEEINDDDIDSYILYDLTLPSTPKARILYVLTLAKEAGF